MTTISKAQVDVVGTGISRHHGYDNWKEACYGYSGENLSIALKGVQCQCAFSEMNHSLSYSDHEQTVCFTVIVVR